LAESCRTADVEIWSWCLMPNDVHVIPVSSDEDGLRRALAPVHRRYAGLVHPRRRIKQRSTAGARPTALAVRWTMASSSSGSKRQQAAPCVRAREALNRADGMVQRTEIPRFRASYCA